MKKFITTLSKLNAPTINMQKLLYVAVGLAVAAALTDLCVIGAMLFDMAR